MPLSDFGNRLKITIDSTKIDSALTDFPCPVKLSAGALADVHAELGSETTNRLKIAFSAADEATQLCTQVIDHATGAYYVRVPSVSASADTVIWLYYDSGVADNTDYVGVAGSLAARSVWVTSFVRVWDLGQDPSGGSIPDSTGYAGYGTPQGSMTAGDLITGQFGKALNFDGSDDYIDFGTGPLGISGDFSISALIRQSGDGAIFSKHGPLNYGVKIVTNADGSIEFAVSPNGVAWYSYTTPVGLVTDGDWKHVVAVSDGGYLRVYVDGAAVGSYSYGSGVNDANGNSIRIASVNLFDNKFAGDIAHVIVADTGLSAAWAKAAYNGYFGTLVACGPIERFAGASESVSASDLPWGQNYTAGASETMGVSTEAKGFFVINAGVTETPVLITESRGGFEVNAGFVETALLTDSAVGFDLSAWLRGNQDKIIGLFFCTLTGSADEMPDVPLPISSFQCRMKNGSPTYVGVVIPGTAQSGDILLRTHGQIKIDMAYFLWGQEQLREEIVRADYDDLSISEGGTNQSLTLTGYLTETYDAPKIVSLTGVVARFVNNGKLRYRFAAPDLYLKPGDTVRAGTDEFVAGDITLTISPDSQSMEVSEAD